MRRSGVIAAASDDSTSRSSTRWGFQSVPCWSAVELLTEHVEEPVTMPQQRVVARGRAIDRHLLAERPRQHLDLAAQQRELNVEAARRRPHEVA